MAVLTLNDPSTPTFFEEWRLDAERGTLRMVGRLLGIRLSVRDRNSIAEVPKMCTYCKPFTTFMFEGAHNKAVKRYLIDLNAQINEVPNAQINEVPIGRDYRKLQKQCIKPTNHPDRWPLY